MTQREVDLKLQTLRSEAALLNSKLCRKNIPAHERVDLKTRYMALAAEIAETKLLKAKIAQDDSSEGAKPRLKIATLVFYDKTKPQPSKVKYFATDLDYLDLLLMLSDVYGEDKPVVASFFGVTETADSKIPEDWFNLEDLDEQ